MPATNGSTKAMGGGCCLNFGFPQFKPAARDALTSAQHTTFSFLCMCFLVVGNTAAPFFGVSFVIRSKSSNLRR
jgi:hypothetical protein